MADLVFSGMTISGGMTFESPPPPIMTLGTRTITYSSGKIFDYVDPVIGASTAGSAVDLTVDKPITCSIQLIAGAGASSGTAVGGTAGGGQVNFTFQPGVTYKVMIGTSGKRGGATLNYQVGGLPGPGGYYNSGTGSGLTTGGGGYSGIFTSSVDRLNSLVVVAGGGGEPRRSRVRSERRERRHRVLGFESSEHRAANAHHLLASMYERLADREQT